MSTSKTKAKGTRMNAAEIQMLQEMTIAGKTDQEIADRLGRNIQTIARKRKELGLKKTIGRKLIADPDTIEKANINATTKEPKKNEEAWRLYFEGTSQYNRIKQVLNQEDFEYFITQWVSHHQYMEDLTPAEEETLELLILQRMRLHENEKSFKQLQEREEELYERLGVNPDQELDLENENQRWLYEMLISNNNLKIENNKERKDLVEKYEKLQRSLNATREQREQRHNIGRDTFMSLVKSFNDRDQRIQMGKYAELMKIATRNKEEEMKKAHKFADGTYEPMLLDGSDYIKPPKVDSQESQEQQ